MLVHQTLSLSDCEIKFAASEGSFSGYGSVFGVLDSKNDIIMPGAYAEVLKSGGGVPVYVNHGWLRGELPVGMWADLKEDDRGLYGQAGLVMQMPSAVNAYWGMKSGLVTGLSVAIIPDSKATERRSDGARVIHRIKAMKEISVVTEPANGESRIVDVKFKDELDQVETIRDFERLLRDVGAFDQAAAKLLTAKARDLFVQRDVGDEESQTKAADDINAAFLIAARGFRVPQ